MGLFLIRFCLNSVLVLFERKDSCLAIPASMVVGCSFGFPLCQEVKKVGLRVFTLNAKQKFKFSCQGGFFPSSFLYQSAAKKYQTRKQKE